MTRRQPKWTRKRRRLAGKTQGTRHPRRRGTGALARAAASTPAARHEHRAASRDAGLSLRTPAKLSSATSAPQPRGEGDAERRDASLSRADGRLADQAKAGACRQLTAR